MKQRMFLLIGLGVLILILLLYFGFLHAKIREHADTEVPKDADYIIILGARVKGETPSLALQYRIDAAANYLKKNKETIAIASGGQGPGEDITEAEAIKRGLVAQGVPSHRVLLEDKSTDTVENISFSKKLIPKHFKTGLIVTNDFHLYRAKSIARDQGLSLKGIPAETPTVAIPKSYIREYLAITKYYLVTVFKN
ncbi:YdcF family protein [Neobacillus sp. DY30]|uniref:YdcF family protein n=1 Tax=Neobacillus sp. DY30 TaxID=3047871 RepID=UPI0024C0AD50|nr:YdcF family protein [Neobacillus sp. DY30]WHY01745.1 YdcF family protein [Neobacillus sp. DY30]